MLAADKLQLQSQLRQQATALKEKEFNLHHENLMTVGTQAAVLAGLDITMFIEFQPASDSEWGENEHVARFLKFIYYGIIVAAFCSNMIVVSQTTVLSVMGAGMALRGPDGSMMVATDALYDERQSVFQVFAIGLACTVGSVLISVWLMLRWESATLCWFVALYTCVVIYRNYKRVSQRFDYDESLTPDFREFMTGGRYFRNNNRSSHKKGSTPQQHSRNDSSRISHDRRRLIHGVEFRSSNSMPENLNDDSHGYSDWESDNTTDIEMAQRDYYHDTRGNSRRRGKGKAVHRNHSIGSQTTSSYPEAMMTV